MTPEELDALDGRGLRAKLEATLKENANLTREVRTSKVSALIQSKGLTRVKPEDFSEVEIDRLEAHALELETQRASTERSTIESVLLRSGLSEDAAKAQADALLGGASQAPPPESGWGNAREAVGIGGQPVKPDFSKMSANEKITYGLTHKSS